MVMKTLLNNQRGVAIILVLGTLAVLSALATDFGFNSQVQLRLARAELSRLQAEYLARSGVNFIRLQMAKERSLKKTIDQLSGGAIDPKVPLCKQFPLSTSMLRAYFGMMAAGIVPGAEGEDGEESKAPETEEVITSFDVSAAEEFINFEGDFEGECYDEGSKLNLNIFATLKSDEKSLSGLNAYDRYKSTIAQFLRQQAVAKLFGGDQDEQYLKIDEVVRNFADWVDADDRVNERPGVQSGSESGVYSGRGDDFAMRNGKMSTLDEAYLIAGVSDEWFTPLRDYFTVYGTEKINICMADPLVVEAMIMSYAENNARIPAINPQNREMIDAAVAQIQTDCADKNPTPQSITTNLEAILVGGGAAPAPGTPVAGAGGGFADLIDVESTIYRIVGIGSVPSGGSRPDVVARVEVVLNIKENDPNRWKVLYWKME